MHKGNRIACVAVAVGAMLLRYDYDSFEGAASEVAEPMSQESPKALSEAPAS